MQNPKVSICGNSIAVADINGSSAYSFNTSGQVGKKQIHQCRYFQIEVSDSGKMAAVLEDNNANYINMYDTNGEKIYSVKNDIVGRWLSYRYKYIIRCEETNSFVYKSERR